MSARSELARAQTRVNLHTLHEMDGPSFVQVLEDAAFESAFLSEKQLQKLWDSGLTYRCMSVLRADRDRDTAAAKALQDILKLHRDGKTAELSVREQDIARWLDHLCRSRVDSDMERAEQRGDFLCDEREGVEA